MGKNTKKKKPEIDAAYFQNYAGSGKSYDETFLDHSGIRECLHLFHMDGAPKVRRVCVLGVGTGKILKLLYDAFGVYSYGCEINEWAFGKVPKKYLKKDRVFLLDLRDFLKEQVRLERRYDLVFTNSLVYLPEKSILSVLRDLSKVGRFVHFDSSFLGSACPDPYRKTLRPYQWWNDRFKKVGFSEKRHFWGEASFLWENRKF